MTDTFMTCNEVADYTGVSPSAISRMSNSGKINSIAVGRRRCFKLSDIDSWLKSRNEAKAAKDHSFQGKRPEGPVALSFFSGALGLDLGMEQAGIYPLLYCENNRECRMTIAQNRPEAALIGDINQYSAEQIRQTAGLDQKEQIDIVFGGPPCQAFSTAGARRAFDDARGNVFLRFLDIAACLAPKYIVIENVRGLLSTAFPLKKGGKPVRGGAMAIILKKIKDSGYTVSFNLYNAANFGAAESRERVIIIARKGNGNPPAWLIPTNAQDTHWQLPLWKTLRDALEPIESMHQHYIDFPEKQRKYFAMLKAGQYWTSLPKNVQADAMGKALHLGGGKTGFYRRLDWSKPSPTLVTSPTMKATALCHPDEIRPLSIEEYKAIQGFPQSWHIYGQISDVYRQIGNAVPILLGRAVAKAVLADMHGEESDKRWDNFPYSRYRHTNQLTWKVSS